MYLASNLKCLREKKGEKQVELAEMLEISRSAYGLWETGDRSPSIENMIALADHFCITVDDLIRKDLRPPKPMYAKNLKFLRKQYGMSQQEMSRLLGLKGKSGCCLVENGKQKLSVEQLLNISEYFGFTLDQFVKQDLSEGEHEQKK